jgi:hypothetical protein
MFQFSGTVKVRPCQPSKWFRARTSAAGAFREPARAQKTEKKQKILS